MSRIVLKLGTGVLSREGGRALAPARFRRLAGEVSGLSRNGHPCIIVSSAAIAAGVHVLGMDGRPEDLAGKQACAAAGQPELMRMYSMALRRHGFRAAQLLLTHDDIDSRMRRQNALNTFERLLAARNVVPIVNENDSVAVEELRFGDNDRLSAEVAQLVKADALLLLTCSDGLVDAAGQRIGTTRDVTRAFEHVRPDKGEFSVGGMRTKLQAVEYALSHGIPAWILDGRKPGQIAAALGGADVGTRFLLPPKRRPSAVLP